MEMISSRWLSSKRRRSCSTPKCSITTHPEEDRSRKSTLMTSCLLTIRMTISRSHRRAANRTSPPGESNQSRMSSCKATRIMVLKSNLPAASRLVTRATVSHRHRLRGIITSAVMRHLSEAPRLQEGTPLPGLLRRKTHPVCPAMVTRLTVQSSRKWSPRASSSS